MRTSTNVVLFSTRVSKGRLLQRVTYAEAVGGSNGGEASPDGTCFLGAPPAAVGVK
ncbi:hypothetical protein J6590_093383 [Homalodisca vitripennis]|nr:hypothetical protein J6590_093383 [Homalodisca vitripennis]